MKSGLPRDPQAIEHARQLVAARDAMKLLWIERVQMHVQPAQSRVVERARMLRQQDAVGSQRKILNPRDARQLRDEMREIAAQQWLAAGKPKPRDSQGRRNLNEALDLLEGEKIFARFEGHRPVRHAIEAAYVAAVGDANAEIVVDPAEAVDQRRRCKRRHGSANIRSIGTRARCIRSAGISTRGCNVANASRSFSSVFILMNGHSLQLQFSLGTK